MITSLRAALSAAMLLGFYIYAFGVVVALGALTVFAFGHTSGALVGKLGFLTLAMAGAILVATWKVLRAKPGPQPGLAIDDRRAPALWAAVREIATVVGTRAPDEIRLVPDVNAAVAEDARLLGLRGGRRYMYIGTPLLQALTVSQLRSVLAHELGHYSHQHTRLGELTYRGSITIAQTIGRVGPSTIGGLLLRPYAAVYHLVSAAVSRRQEIEADRASVRVAGRRAAASALRELPALDAAWGFYLNQYVAWGLDSGKAPADVLANFPHMLTARAGELARLRDKGEQGPRSRYDSHPPIAVRVALIEREPESPAAEDNRPAGILVPGFDTAAAELERLVFDFGERDRLAFPEYSAAAAAYTAQTEADVLFRAAARLAGDGAASLAGVFGLLEAGRAEDLMRALFKPTELADRPGVQARFRSYLVAAIATAVVAAGAARWRHSWSDPMALVGPDGQPFTAVQQLATAAVDRRLGEVRQWLSASGVDLAAATLRETNATARGASVQAGIVNVVVDGQRSDVIILDTGLIIGPGVPRLKMKSAKPRMYRMLTEVRPDRLATMPGHRFIPLEEITAGRQTRKMPVTFELRLHGGELMKIRWGAESEELGEGWKALGTVVFSAGAAT